VILVLNFFLVILNLVVKEDIHLANYVKESEIILNLSDQLWTIP
jgi:hypothetical protein